MPAPLRSTPRSSALVASQNTAPVAEFRCLFTHDIRRKQKRWQDGFLKFHSFNNRVMVYDQARNYLGDTYYKDSDQLHEGDELNLDKGVMVEVAETMGVTQTDLTPLFEKRAKESPTRPNIPSLARLPEKPSPAAPTNALRATSQLRHKSLNTLLGTTRGLIGKAVPIHSPFEVRKEKENEREGERIVKRQKTNHHSASLTGVDAVQAKGPTLITDPTPSAGAVGAHTTRKPAKFIPPAAKVINLESESDHAPAILPDATPPSSPGLFKTTTGRTGRSGECQKRSVQTPKMPRRKVPVPKPKTMETPKQLAPPSSPPVSVSNRLTNVDFAVQPAKLDQRETSPPPSPPRNPKTRSLRLSTGVKRGKLLCQSLPRQASKSGTEFGRALAELRSKEVSCKLGKEPALTGSLSSGNCPREDVSAIPRKPGLSNEKQKDGVSNEKATSKRPNISAVPSGSPLDIFDDPEIVHGIMDQQLLIPLSPPIQLYPQEAPSSPLLENVQTRPGADEKTIDKTKASGQRSIPKLLDPEATRPRSSPRNAIPKVQQHNNTKKNVHVISKPLTTHVTAFDVPLQTSRDVSPTRTEASDIRSRTSSVSPNKKALSTGGFHKKQKNPLKNSSATALIIETSTSGAIPPVETVALLPQPQLQRAGKRGPLMTTTELAALLKKPKRAKKALDGPIEEQSSGIQISPNRSFRRVRSENDALIPSMAEDWEKRNLPKTSGNLTEKDNEPATGVATTSLAPLNKRATGLSALIRKTDPRRKVQRTQSLRVETSVPPIQDVETTSPIADTDIGPWSTEAFDLFDWRPPNRE